MVEENQVQQVMKEPQQVTTKNPNKVKAGKRLAEYNHRKREEKREEAAKKGKLNQYYGIGAILAVGVIGGLGYYIYRTKKGQAGGEVKDASTTHNPTVSQQPSTKANKFEMD